MKRTMASGRGSVTSRDVAKAANVSQALVSRAFTGNGRVAPQTRAHILDVAREIGWQPNALARSMVTGDAPLIAVITTRLDFDWRAQVLSRLLKAIQSWQLKPLLFYADNDEDVDRLLAETIGWRTRGVIVTPVDLYRRPLYRFTAEFLGMTNVLQAELDGAECRLPWGAVRPVENPHVSNAEGIAIRPEDIGIAPASDDADGTIEQAVFMGAATHYTVRVARMTLRVIAAGGQSAILEPGQPVRLDLPRVLRLLKPFVPAEVAA